MTVEVAPMPHATALAEDFLTLSHWYEYGTNARSYELRPEAAVETGQALALGDSGVLRLARPTSLEPGGEYVFTWWAHRHAGVGPSTFDLRTDSSGDFLRVLRASTSALALGWNRCIARVEVPDHWPDVQLGLFNEASLAGGMLARIRAVPADAEEATV